MQEPSSGAVGRPFVALSRFAIANGMTEPAKQAFVHRPHLVEAAPGFVRLDVISPVDTPNEIWLLTYWADEQSYRTWHGSHDYRIAHAGIPSGLRLVRGSAELRYFEHVSS